MIKVLLADDHSMVREGIKQLLELDGDIKVIGEAGNGEDCLKLIHSLKPDVVLLDINMPQMNGLEVLDIVRKTDPSQKIILLTIHNEVEYLMRALEIGISGYLLKDSESEVLKNAIHSVYNGENYIDATMTPLLKEQNYLKKVQSEARSNDNLLSKLDLTQFNHLEEVSFYNIRNINYFFQ